MWLVEPMPAKPSATPPAAGDSCAMNPQGPSVASAVAQWPPIPTGPIANGTHKPGEIEEEKERASAQAEDCVIQRVADAVSALLASVEEAAEESARAIREEGVAVTE